jgi:hypothetical protein
MPQRDVYHWAVREALIRDGWTITHDPYTVTFGERYALVDLGAELTLAAERSGRKIAVEIKSFVGRSPVADLGEALGKYLLYRSWRRRTEPERVLYLAIDTYTARDVFADVSAQVLLEDDAVRLLVVDVAQERIEEWKEPPSTGRS